jgi:hypothetical protein
MPPATWGHTATPSWSQALWPSRQRRAARGAKELANRKGWRYSSSPEERSGDAEDWGHSNPVVPPAGTHHFAATSTPGVSRLASPVRPSAGTQSPELTEAHCGDTPVGLGPHQPACGQSQRGTDPPGKHGHAGTHTILVASPLALAATQGGEGSEGISQPKRLEILK